MVELFLVVKKKKRFNEEGVLFNKTVCVIVFMVFGFLSSASFSLASPPQLKVSGNQIVTASGGCTVRLTGVNLDSLEWQAQPGDGPSGGNGVMTQLQEAVKYWNVNCVRIPLDQDWWDGNAQSTPNNRGSTSQSGYQNFVDSLVAFCNTNNIYCDIDLQWSGSGSTGSATEQYSMPDNNSLVFWASVAARYANNPSVLFDTFNEPYTTSWTTWLNGGTTSEGFTTPGLQSIVNTIRATTASGSSTLASGSNAENICIVGGQQYSYYYVGMSPVVDKAGGNGIVYSAHIYNNKGTNNATGWQTNIDPALAYGPVFIEEFGNSANTTDNGSFVSSVLTFMNGTNDKNYVYGGLCWDMDIQASPMLLSAWSSTLSAPVSSGSGWVLTSYEGQTVYPWLKGLTHPACGSGGNTPTFTFTATKSFTPTSSPTSTATRTVTPTTTATFTATRTATSTPTNTVGNTSTTTMTFTRTTTPTNTSSTTPTNTMTATRTSTPTLTATAVFTSTTTATKTMTATLSSTATPVNTATPTNTATAVFTSTTTSTRTVTSTFSPTSTPVNTATPTNTATTVFTSTTTSTKTMTATLSPTTTSTSVFTGTSTNTPQFTYTVSLTPTATLSMTSTPTHTTVSTSTFTSTPVNTTTPTNTATAVFTSTSTSTKTMTATLSPTTTSTSVFTGTSTETPQFSYTVTLTPTVTLSMTSTPTHTTVPTATFTLTPTNTSTLTGTFTSTATSSPTRTMSFTPTVTLSPTDTGTPTNTFQFSPTITSTLTTTRTPTDSFTPTVTFTPTWTSTATSTFTPTRTWTPTFTSTDTWTSTPSFTSTPSGTSTSTPTKSFTPTNTFTSTYTYTPTHTATITYTPTWTFTPTSTTTQAPTPLPGHVGIYPNPVTGPTVNILPPSYVGYSNVRVEIFTINFRKVQDTTFDSVPTGTAVVVSLTGRGGNPLANGLYYVVVTTNSGRAIGKLLVLR